MEEHNDRLLNNINTNPRPQTLIPVSHVAFWDQSCMVMVDNGCFFTLQARYIESTLS